MRSNSIPILILGAGPAGLGAALQLARRGAFDVTVLERNDVVGGNAGSFECAGLRVDYGSHRLHPACSPEILADIRQMLGRDLMDRPRHGRIFLRGRWLHFPLKPLDLTLKLPASFVLGALQDMMMKPFRANGAPTFASVLERSLGPTICREFYFPYAKKIWGLDPSELDAEQARRRVSANSLGKLLGKVLRAVPGLKPKGSGRFFYPRRGYGQISEAYHDAAVAAGVTVHLQTTVAQLEVIENRVVAVRAQGEDGSLRLTPRHTFSTIPLPLLLRAVRPPPPSEVMASTDQLRYRAMVLVYLVLETEQFTEYDAHYFPDANLTITRLSEPKNYSLASLPGRTVLCAEIPCAAGDEVWSQNDEALSDLLKEDLARAGIPITVPIRQVTTCRLAQAYPIYKAQYREHFERMDAWANTIAGLTTLGRQGLFAHDNTHHTLAMAYAASRCMSEDGTFDRTRWAEYRREFESHVVED